MAPAGPQLALQTLDHLFAELRLELRLAGEEIDHAREFTETRDPLARI